MSKYKAIKAKISNRGIPPDSFLDELITWAKTAPESIFSSNAVPVDIFTVIKSRLATQMGVDGSDTLIWQWESLRHRRAALMEAMRVHAGLESSWDWNEGVDRTNQTSMKNIAGQETGIFQVSFDSLNLGAGAMKPFAKERGIQAVGKFISEMKRDHVLALEYYARLVRVSIRWAGPLLRQRGPDSVYPYLSRAAVAEFQELLTA